jgi:hypothetical protein
VQGAELKLKGSELRVQGFRDLGSELQGAGFRVQGPGLKGSEFRASWFRVQR